MDHLNIIQWNAQSLSSNKHAFTYFLYNNDIHIALISETWLKPEKKFHIKGYKIERLDIGSNHNGVAILIKNNLNYIRLNTLHDDSLQNIAIRLQFNNEEISIVSFYSPTSAASQNFTYTHINNLIDSLPKPLLLAGDFNAHHTMWGCTSNNGRGTTLHSIIEDSDLCILNDGQATTVGSHKWRPNALDLTIVSSSLSLRCNWSVHNDPMGSYHLPTVTSILFSYSENTNNKASQGNFSKPSYINVDWFKYKQIVDSKILDHTFDFSDPILSYTIFCNILLESVNDANTKPKNITLSHNTNHKKRLCLPWWNQTCTAAIEQCRKVYLQFKSDPSMENYISFKKQQALKKLSLNKEREASWTAFCELLNRQTPLSTIWKTIRKFNKTYHNNNIKSSTNSSWIQDFLNKFSSNPQSQVNFNIHVSNTHTHNEFLTKSFTLPELHSALNSRRDTAFGLDNISYKMLKNLSVDVKKMLILILNLLWNASLIPPEWKIDCLVPILKPGKDNTNHNSYRPIALTSCFGKLFEQMLKQRLEFYIESNKLLPSNQFGFRRGFSAAESMNNLYLDIHSAFAYNRFLVCVFLDIVGAFNNVDHKVLTRELLTLGIPVKIIAWIFYFLHGRQVYVKFNNNLYGPKLSYLGVCQGGILSPLLFILYIHKLNIVLGPEVTNLQYADDLAVYCSESNMVIAENKLNTALKKLKVYFNYLKLDISLSKSKVVVFSRSRNLCANLYYNDNLIPMVDEFKFLGVIFTKNLSWNKHVYDLSDRASKAFNILKPLARTSWGADPKILLMLYKSIVRSHFEYSYFCYASNSILIKKLEIIQNNSLRLITGAMKTTPIISMQVECNVPPLHLRFKFLKFKFLLKLFAISHHALLRKLQHSQTIPSSINSPKYPFILLHFSNFMAFVEQYNIYKAVDKWACYEDTFESKFCAMRISINNDLKSKEDFDQHITEWPDFHCIYTDASKSDQGVSLAYYHNNIKVGYGFGLPPSSSIFTAEALAILHALKYIKEDICARKQNKWLIVSDSMSVLSNLQNNCFSNRINHVIYHIKKLWTDLRNQNITVEFTWTPAHCGVVGNEKVDNFAKSINNLGGQIKNISIPWQDLIPDICQQINKDWLENRRHMNETKGKWYAEINNEIGIKPWFARSKYFCKRKFYTQICRLRFGHCKFSAHLYRMKITSSPNCNKCSLNEEQTLHHIFFTCPAFNIHRILFIDKLQEVYKDSIPPSLQELLKCPASFRAVYEYITSTFGDL
ncbi:RNA-directed DNA polymerase from mobile element jockey isoform X1 [Bombyx mori]|uniref:RNA-directed DNA polymerase from mobile element jockey isoform X1 n=1 Tax=Bombyx mori TaxID=7091 RepID=UPI002ED43BE2